ncbi:MAG TPA: histidine triad nucleotide-binding protein [Dermatophilaceae bacterium]|nr:histidine triad nucleotide-binding protein [Dermatophilaceae bacterium]
MSDAPRDPDCLFCSIVAGDVPATVVASSERSLAFRDIEPKAPVHVLIVPRRHLPTVAELAQESPEELADLVLTARAVADAEGLDQGYRLVFNTGPDAGQAVFHAHLHVLGGAALGWR